MTSYLRHDGGQVHEGNIHAHTDTAIVNTRAGSKSIGLAGILARQPVGHVHVHTNIAVCEGCDEYNDAYKAVEMEIISHHTDVSPEPAVFGPARINAHRYLRRQREYIDGTP